MIRRNSTGWASAVLEPTMKKQWAFFQVGIAADRLVRPERGHVAADRTGHAQPGIALDVVGLQPAAHDF